MGREVRLKSLKPSFKTRLRRCVNCGWGGHRPRVYLCLCADCWRPAIISALLSLVAMFVWSLLFETVR